MNEIPATAENIQNTTFAVIPKSSWSALSVSPVQIYTPQAMEDAFKSHGIAPRSRLSTVSEAFLGSFEDTKIHFKRMDILDDIDYFFNLLDFACRTLN